MPDFYIQQDLKIDWHDWEFVSNELKRIGTYFFYRKLLLISMYNPFFKQDLVNKGSQLSFPKKMKGLPNQVMIATVLMAMPLTKSLWIEP